MNCCPRDRAFVEPREIPHKCSDTDGDNDIQLWKLMERLPEQEYTPTKELQVGMQPAQPTLLNVLNRRKSPQPAREAA